MSATHCDKEKIIHQFLDVQSQVTIVPVIKHGKPTVHCIETDIKSACDREENRRDCYRPRRESERSDGKCAFTITQVLCVEIPIELEVDVDVDEGTIHCCKPGLGPCRPPCKEPE